MTADIVLLLLQDGIVNAAVYTLLAVALILVFSVTRIIFIPQGELVTFAALSLAAMEAGRVAPALALLVLVAALSLASDAWRWWRGDRSGLRTSLLWGVGAPALAAAIAYFGPPTSYLGRLALLLVIVVPLGPLLYRVVYRPLASATVLTLLMASMALHVVLVGIGLHLFGPEGSRTEAPSQVQWDVAGLQVSAQGVLVVLATAILVGFLFAAFRFSIAGKALRAAAMNRAGAAIVGIPVPLASELAMAIAAGIAAITAALVGPITTLYYDSGFLIGLKGFVAAIMGGLGSYVAGFVGAAIVGVMESFASFWLSAFKEAIVFGLILPFMWWRSLGARHQEDE